MHNRMTDFFETDCDQERLRIALAVARARVHELELQNEVSQLDTDYKSWREGLWFGLSAGSLLTIGLWWLSSLVLG